MALSPGLTNFPLLLATGSDVDYQSLDGEQVTFLAGDANGMERCINITLQEDSLVECEEEFNVTLAIIMDKPNLMLGGATTTVIIMDSDGATPACATTVTLFFTILSPPLISMQRLPSPCQLLHL